MKKIKKVIYKRYQKCLKLELIKFIELDSLDLSNHWCKKLHIVPCQDNLSLIKLPEKLYSLAINRRNGVKFYLRESFCKEIFKSNIKDLFLRNVRGLNDSKMKYFLKLDSLTIKDDWIGTITINKITNIGYKELKNLKRIYLRAPINNIIF